MNRSARPAHFNPRVYAVVACGVAFVLFLSNVVPLPALPGPVPAQAVSPLRTVPSTDVNPFGGNFFLDWEVEPWKVEKTLQMAKEAGLGWASLHFVWEGLELKKNNYWNDRVNKSTWDKHDFIVSTAEKYGLKIIARLDRPPAWTRRDNTRPERPPDDLNNYGDFVAAAVARYKGRIRHFQIWNEPNIYPEWGDQEVDPVAYVDLLKTAYQRAKGVDPNVYILSAPLAQTTERSLRNLSELDFLDAMYRAGAKNYFDILSANGYGFDAPPNDPPDPKKLNFARVLLLRQVMERHGDANKAVWFHEFGWNASPDSIPSDKLVWRRVTEQQQAEYTVQAIRKARSEWPWAGVFSIWYFRQDGHIAPDVPEYYFRMVDPGFTPRMVYNAVARVAKETAVAGPGSYQEANPALTVDSDWREERDVTASGEAWLVADKPGASVTIKFRGTDFSIVATKEPNGARLLVTVDGRTANLLSSGGEGRSYLDLSSPARQASIAVPVVSNLQYGQHIVRMVVGPQRGTGTERAVLDGFQVRASGDAPSPRAIAGVTVLLFALVLAGAWWRRSRRGDRV